MCPCTHTHTHTYKCTHVQVVLARNISDDPWTIARVPEPGVKQVYTCDIFLCVSGRESVLCMSGSPVCMYVCMYVCMICKCELYVCMICMCIRTDMWTHIQIHTHIHTHTHTHIHTHTHTHTHAHIHTHTYTHTHTERCSCKSSQEHYTHNGLNTYKRTYSLAHAHRNGTDLRLSKVTLSAAMKTGN